MGNGLGYRAKALEAYGGESLGINGLYRGRNLSLNYLPIGRLDSLEASYSVGMFVLEKYLRTIDIFANSYSIPMAKPYSVEPRAGRQSYKPEASTDRKDLKVRCPRCGTELNIIGACTACRGSPSQENVKKGNLFEQ